MYTNARVINYRAVKFVVEAVSKPMVSVYKLQTLFIASDTARLSRGQEAPVMKCQLECFGCLSVCPSVSQYVGTQVIKICRCLTRIINAV